MSIYHRSRHHLERLPSRARSLHARVWLQLLSSAELIELTSASYEQQYGFEAEDHNLAGLWPWEEAMVKQYLGGCRTVLVAAAGAGREMIALARAGFDVSGFDPSRDLVSAGHQHLRTAGVQARLIHADPCEVPKEFGVFDAVVIGRGALHHIPGRERRIGFLADCRTLLETGSRMLILDFLTRSSKRVGRFGRHEYGDHIADAFFHKFNHAEIRSELEAARFELFEYRPTDFPGGGSLAQAAARAV